MEFENIPKTIKCQRCGKAAFRATASHGSFDLHAGYCCRQCGWVSNRSWAILERDDYPTRFKCSQCRRWAKPDEAKADNRVRYSHPLNDKIHFFELEWTDQGWGTYQGRSEIVRVYDTRWDCLLAPA